MFDKLIDILILIWNDLWMFKIINQNEKGILLRMGKMKKILNPGLVFKIPFIDQVLQQYVQDDTIALPSQKLITKDGKGITITGMVLYSVEDVEPFILNASIPAQTISDITAGVISQQILELDYNEILESLEKLSHKISIAVRRECKGWGVKIEYVKLTDITVSRSFNIFKNNEGHL